MGKGQLSIVKMCLFLLLLICLTGTFIIVTVILVTKEGPEEMNSPQPVTSGVVLAQSGHTDQSNILAVEMDAQVIDDQDLGQDQSQGLDQDQDQVQDDVTESAEFELLSNDEPTHDAADSSHRSEVAGTLSVEGNPVSEGICLLIYNHGAAHEFIRVQDGQFNILLQPNDYELRDCDLLVNDEVLHVKINYQLIVDAAGVYLDLRLDKVTVTLDYIGQGETDGGTIWLSSHKKPKFMIDHPFDGKVTEFYVPNTDSWYIESISLNNGDILLEQIPIETTDGNTSLHVDFNLSNVFGTVHFSHDPGLRSAVDHINIMRVESDGTFISFHFAEVINGAFKLYLPEGNYFVYHLAIDRAEREFFPAMVPFKVGAEGLDDLTLNLNKLQLQFEVDTALVDNGRYSISGISDGVRHAVTNELTNGQSTLFLADGNYEIIEFAYGQSELTWLEQPVMFSVPEESDVLISLP